MNSSSLKKQSSSASLWSFETLAETGLLRRLSITLGLLVVYRFGIFVPLSGIDQVLFKQFAQQQFNTGVLSVLDMFAGGGLSALSVVALGIGPYITASIMMQLLGEVFPSLKALNRENGEEGRKKYQQYSRRLTGFIAFMQGFGIANMLGHIVVKEQNIITSEFPYFLFVLKTALLLTAGSLFVMWLGELISEFGIGNGGSLLIFAAIASRVPSMITNTYDSFQAGAIPTWGMIVLILFFLLLIVVVIYLQEGIRKLLVVNSRSGSAAAVGGGAAKVAGDGHYLPLKINPAGVLPVIFTMMTLSVPAQIFKFTGEKYGIRNFSAIFQKITDSQDAFFSSESWSWIVTIFNFLGKSFDNAVSNRVSIEFSLLTLLLIVAFSYFYASILLPAREIAENLQKGGITVQGIKPGKPTGDYLDFIINRLVFIGAIILSIIMISPPFVENWCQVMTLGSLGGTSIIIMVGVSLDLFNQMNAYLNAHEYKERSFLS